MSVVNGVPTFDIHRQRAFCSDQQNTQLGRLEGLGSSGKVSSSFLTISELRRQHMSAAEATGVVQR
jgi:hypothetical protein